MELAKKWKIIYYHTPNHQEPVYNFIESLDSGAQAKLSTTFDLLIEYGTRLGLPHVKKMVNTDLWELRILGADNIRLFYVATFNHQFLLLHGYLKKSQKIAKKEIKTALNRLKEYRQTNSLNITKK